MYSLKVKCRRALKSFVRSLGYDIVAFPKLVGAYEKISLHAYAPWKEHTLFNQCFSEIQPYTLIDKRRCFDLWELVEQSKTLSGSLIEIGVWKGGSGALIAQQAALCEMNEPVYLCDTFQGVVKAGGEDSVYKGAEHSDTSKRAVQKLLDRIGLQNTKILEGVFPDETGGMIQNESFRFCHIDVDVYQSAKEVVEWIWPRMVLGGIVVFDDYGQVSCSGITAYLKEKSDDRDKICVNNLNGHCVWVKVK